MERNQFGPTSYAGAVARISRYHDYFYCPYKDEAWHQEALELLQEIEDTHSKSLAAMMEQDLSRLLRVNLPQDK